MALDNTTTTSIGAQAAALASIVALALAVPLLTGCAEDKQSPDAAYSEAVAQTEFNWFWRSTEGIERRNSTIDRLSSIFNIFNNNLGRNINVVACIQEAIDRVGKQQEKLNQSMYENPTIGYFTMNRHGGNDLPNMTNPGPVCPAEAICEII